VARPTREGILNAFCAGREEGRRQNASDFSNSSGEQTLTTKNFENPIRQNRYGKGSILPDRDPDKDPTINDHKLSDLLMEMAGSILRNPNRTPSEPSMAASIGLATAAWNASVLKADAHKLAEAASNDIDWEGMTPWSEHRSGDVRALVDVLVAYKRKHFPDDEREVLIAELSPNGNLRVHWKPPDKVVRPDFGGNAKRALSKVWARPQPIAAKLKKMIDRYRKRKVIDLRAVAKANSDAEDLQRSIVKREDLTDYHPAHALYVYAENQMSVIAEQLSALKELARFERLISAAEEEYMPGGPPMSPLTKSFFVCWSLFDACAGLGDETIGSVITAIGSTIGLDPELRRIFEILHTSRMGIYAHEGINDDGTVCLRELVTSEILSAVPTSGYKGQRGELWYVRLLPPPVPEAKEYIVFTTPYQLVMTGEDEWNAYFRRTLSVGPTEKRIGEYERLMKFGPNRNYWNEFVFEAYVNHRSDVIFLKGLPDIAASRPHSAVNEK
jgi:hypothetical protein